MLRYVDYTFATPSPSEFFNFFCVSRTVIEGLGWRDGSVGKDASCASERTCVAYIINVKS